MKTFEINKSALVLQRWKVRAETEEQAAEELDERITMLEEIVDRALAKLNKNTESKIEFLGEEWSETETEVLEVQ